MLEKALQGKDWLLGDKCTWADLAFVPWSLQIDFLMRGWEGEVKWDVEQFPAFKAWQARMLEKEGCKKAVSKMLEKEVISEGTRQ